MYTFIGVKGDRVFIIRARSAEAADKAIWQEPGIVVSATEPWKNGLDHLYNLSLMKVGTWENGQVKELKPDIGAYDEKT